MFNPWRSVSLIGKILLGVFICSTAFAAKPIRLQSISQFDAAIRFAGYGSKSVIFVLNPRDFANDQEAQQVIDAVQLAKAWDFWMLPDGEVVAGLRDKMNFIISDSVVDSVSPQARADQAFDWLWERTLRAPHISEEGALLMQAAVPMNLEPLKATVEFVLAAKTAGDMENAYRDPRARLHAFRQVSRKIHEVSLADCARNLTAENQNE